MFKKLCFRVIANTPSRLVFFLVAAFCRRAKALSHSQQMGWLVGAVGIEPATLGSSGSLPGKEKSVPFIWPQGALFNASFRKNCDLPPPCMRLYKKCHKTDRKSTPPKSSDRHNSYA